MKKTAPISLAGSQLAEGRRVCAFSPQNLFVPPEEFLGEVRERRRASV